MLLIGQLGDGTTTDRHHPTAVSTDLTFSTITIGYAHVCALQTGTGAAFCWGANDQGQLADGTTTDRHTPTAVSTNLTFSTITSFNAHVCALQTDSGLAYCWGAVGTYHALLPSKRADGSCAWMGGPTPPPRRLAQGGQLG